jgi:hypothetical protein
LAEEKGEEMNSECEVLEKSSLNQLTTKSNVSLGCFQRVALDPSHHISDIGTRLVISWGEGLLTTK